MRAGDPANSRTKSQVFVYKTDDGKVVVEDEFLNFTVVKMRTLSLLATKHSLSDWIKESKRMVFEKYATFRRCVLITRA